MGKYFFKAPSSFLHVLIFLGIVLISTPTTVLAIPSVGAQRNLEFILGNWANGQCKAKLEPIPRVDNTPFSDAFTADYFGILVREAGDSTTDDEFCTAVRVGKGLFLTSFSCAMNKTHAHIEEAAVSVDARPSTSRDFRQIVNMVNESSEDTGNGIVILELAVKSGKDQYMGVDVGTSLNESEPVRVFNFAKYKQVNWLLVQSDVPRYDTQQCREFFGANQDANLNIDNCVGSGYDDTLANSNCTICQTGQMGGPVVQYKYINDSYIPFVIGVTNWNGGSNCNTISPVTYMAIEGRAHADYLGTFDLTNLVVTDGGRKGLGISGILGIAFGVVLFILILVTIGVCLVRRRKRNPETEDEIVEKSLEDIGTSHDDMYVEADEGRVGYQWPSGSEKQTFGEKLAERWSGRGRSGESGGEEATIEKLESMEKNIEGTTIEDDVKPSRSGSFDIIEYERGTVGSRGTSG